MHVLWPRCAEYDHPATVRAGAERHDTDVTRYLK